MSINHLDGFNLYNMSVILNGRLETNGRFIVGPEMVNDGLIIHLDAGNPLSYPGTGNSWFNLKGPSFTGTLINGPTFNPSNSGSIVFDGTNDYASLPGSISVVEATLLIWVYRNGNQPNYAGIFYSRGSEANGLSFYSTTNTLTYVWNTNPNTFTFNSGLVVPNLQWSMCAVSISASNAVLYVGSSSGLFSATNNVSHSPTTIDALRIASDNYWSPFNGNVSVAKFYDRALSQAEIEENFNSIKGRYGIL
jgi:hypothetical protein